MQTTGLIVQIDPSLTETAPWRKMTKENLVATIQRKIGQSARPMHTPMVPEDALIQDSFLDGLSTAYSLHQKISFGPHDLWYVMLSEVARLVNASADTYRHLFTKSAEKIEILVPTPGITILPLELITSELRRMVPVDLDLFLPEFTTHTDQSRVACMAAFADTCKSYYNYMTFMCGIRELEVRGSVDDWVRFASHLDGIQAAFNMDEITIWTERMKSRITQIIASLNGGPTDFYRDIFTQKNVGSGGELLIDGWFANDFFEEKCSLPKITNFPLTWSMVPFKNIDTGRTFTDVHGCFYSTKSEGGFKVPQYGRFTFETFGAK